MPLSDTTCPIKIDINISISANIKNRKIMNISTRTRSILMLWMLLFCNAPTKSSAWIVPMGKHDVNLLRRHHDAPSPSSHSKPKPKYMALSKRGRTFIPSPTGSSTCTGISTRLSAASPSTSPSPSPSMLIIESLEVAATLSSGLDPFEIDVLMDIISSECQQLGIHFIDFIDHVSTKTEAELDTNTDTNIIWELDTNTNTNTIPGTMGRVLLVEVWGFESQDRFDLLEELELGVCEQIDLLLLQNDATLKDAVLVCFQTDDDMYRNKERLGIDFDAMGLRDCTRYLSDIVAQHIQEYELASPIELELDEFNNNNDTQLKVNLNLNMPEKSFIPCMHVEMDGGYVSHHDVAEYWDSSTLLVFDDLVSQDLRKRLLDVMVGGDSELEYHDARNGPDPNRWVSGVLLDVPDNESKTGSSAGTGAGSNSNTDGIKDGDVDIDIDMDEQEGGWGLKDECLQEICYEPHAAIQEMESILSRLFANFTVSRLPATVLGGDITPLTANAPTAVDIFDYHIDADPNLTPSSPWTDVYGRYPNRAQGKPRFMSCLIYLNEEWNSDEWGAPTRFVDVPTDDVEKLNVYDVQARPGRCVIMDQDMGHTVVAPNASAGKRPRYSLVWKLILHPQSHGQDMKDLAGERGVLWPDVEYFGSAALHGKDEKSV